MDQVDKSILAELKKDARKSFVKIAEKLHVSEGTVRMRVKKMEEDNIIQTYTILTNDKNVVQALVSIKIETTIDTHKIASEVAQISESSFNFEIMGEFDLLTLINAKNTDELDEKIEQIRKLKGVVATTSALVLKKYV